MTATTTEITTLDDDRKQLLVSVPWQEVAVDYDEVVAEYRRLAMPGFRPGKVPGAVVRRHYAKEIAEEFVARCAGRLSRSVLAEQDVTPAAGASIVEHDIREGDAFSFTAEFLPVPDFDLPDFLAIPLAATDDEALRDTISAWLLNTTTVDVPDGLVEEELSLGDAPAAPETPEWEEARGRVALLLILRKIARQDGIEIGDDDVENRARAVAEASGTRLDQLMTELRQKGGFPRLRAMLLAEATLDYLMEANTKPQ